MRTYAGVLDDEIERSNLIIEQEHQRAMFAFPASGSVPSLTGDRWPDGRRLLPPQAEVASQSSAGLVCGSNQSGAWRRRPLTNRRRGGGVRSLLISWLSWWVWSTWRERSLAACSQSWRPIARCSASSRSWRCSVSRPSVLVANRALEPLSKLASTTWVAERVAVPGLDTVDVDSCYRSMDWLLEIEAELAEAVSWSTADLLNLEVDLLFFDTTSTYFEIETPDAPGEGDNVGFRAFGHSKDHRPDLPQPASTISSRLTRPRRSGPMIYLKRSLLFP